MDHICRCSLFKFETFNLLFVLSAPSCFVTAEVSREEAALTHWRPLMHTEGDHMTLINIYNAFLERKHTSAFIA